MDSLKKELKDTDGYMKAPNGKKTFLTERQWLAVRTKSFKNWFGDWELDDGEIYYYHLDMLERYGTSR